MGGNASKSGLIDALFDMQPKYLLIDEIEHLKPEYQTTLLSLMETGILTQTMYSKVRHIQLIFFQTLKQIMDQIWFRESKSGIMSPIPHIAS